MGDIPLQNFLGPKGLPGAYLEQWGLCAVLMPRSKAPSPKPRAPGYRSHCGGTHCRRARPTLQLDIRVREGGGEGVPGTCRSSFRLSSSSWAASSKCVWSLPLPVSRVTSCSRFFANS